MLELVKRNIHMNRWKNRVSTQITLDDDFIVPDTMSDVSGVILTSGEIQLEPVKIQKEKAAVRGKLDFHLLYRREEGGLQTMGGLIPFEETVNVPELEERDYAYVNWQLEDLHADMINSRKLGIKAVVTLEVKVEALVDTEAAQGLGKTEDADREENGTAPQIEIKTEKMDVAAIALRRKDTYRVREEITLSGNKPAIDRLLWTEMRLAGVNTKPLDGKVALDGTLLVFALYEGEGEQEVVQWVESSIPFSGELEMQGAVEEMIPAISARLIHKGIEEKPDYDGEMRELSVDAVIELDIRLYEEEKLEFLSDLYATNRELKLEIGEACFDQILTRNTGKCKVTERIDLSSRSRILQVCHSVGTVKIDEAVAGTDLISVDGVLELQILYLTDEDEEPIRSVTEPIPFHYEAEAPGITEDCVWYMETGLEQLTVAMAGGEAAEVKAVIALDMLVLCPARKKVIKQAEITPLDTKKLQEMPGIVGYLVQEGDTLWDVAKRFHTTMETVIQTNNLPSEQLTPGECLVLVKEINH